MISNSDRIQISDNNASAMVNTDEYNRKTIE
jgi:hypothetical protein